VTYRGKNRYNFRGYLDYVGRDEVVLAYGAARGLPLQVQYGDDGAAQNITLMGADYRRKN